MAASPPPPGFGPPPGTAAGGGPWAGPGGEAPPAPVTNGFAIASLVCGIAGLAICPATAIAAVILGPLALRQMATYPGHYEGRRMAVVGQILGWLGIVGWGAVGAFVAALTLYST